MTQPRALEPQEALGLLRERVLPALERQSSLYGRLAAFGPKQDALIAQGEGEGLLRLMAERQDVVDELVGVHRALEDVRRSWDQFVQALPDADRRELGERLDALKALAAAVHEQDTRTRERLDEVRDRVQQSMGDLGRAKGALRAYGGGTSRQPMHQDRQA
ncbi:MAG: hypothetical protein KatS3mg103_0178 [Phycisphaerales bacterium]|nr:MAG: hypothetical protein KatS3mg103_0178 [Phycisphaerales bacterium]